MTETIKDFQKRKREHIQLSLESKTQAHALSDFDHLQLTPEALPDLDFSEVELSRKIWGLEISKPFFISSMTAGTKQSEAINIALAKTAEAHGLLMGVGSQRRQLFDKKAALEWQRIRKSAPKTMLLGNIGIAQLIQSPFESIIELVESIQAVGLFVHLNGLQEVLQAEGTPEFRGSYRALESLCKKLSIPVIVKEVGCGISENTARRLKSLGVKNIDVSGAGGTHWGRLEGYRQDPRSLKSQAAETFANWGLSTLESLRQVRSVYTSNEEHVLASGGVRNGLDVAKCLALGADLVGLAQPFMKAAIADTKGADTKGASVKSSKKNLKNLDFLVERLSFETKTSLFCTGCKNVDEIRKKKVWYVPKQS